MQPTPKISRDEYIRQMRQEVEEMLGQVADAINNAPPGHIISGSEEKVRDLFADLRKSLQGFARDCHNHLMEYIKTAKSVVFGIEPLIGYLFAVETEIHNVRLIMRAKLYGLDMTVAGESLRIPYG